MTIRKFNIGYLSAAILSLVLFFSATCSASAQESKNQHPTLKKLFKKGEYQKIIDTVTQDFNKFQKGFSADDDLPLHVHLWRAYEALHKTDEAYKFFAGLWRSYLKNPDYGATPSFWLDLNFKYKKLDSVKSAIDTLQKIRPRGLELDRARLFILTDKLDSAEIMLKLYFAREANLSRNYVIMSPEIYDLLASDRKCPGIEAVLTEADPDTVRSNTLQNKVSESIFSEFKSKFIRFDSIKSETDLDSAKDIIFAVESFDEQFRKSACGNMFELLKTLKKGSFTRIKLATFIFMASQDKQASEELYKVLKNDDISTNPVSYMMLAFMASKYDKSDWFDFMESHLMSGDTALILRKLLDPDYSGYFVRTMFLLQAGDEEFIPKFISRYNGYVADSLIAYTKELFEPMLAKPISEKLSAAVNEDSKIFLLHALARIPSYESIRYIDEYAKKCTGALLDTINICRKEFFEGITKLLGLEETKRVRLRMDCFADNNEKITSPRIKRLMIVNSIRNPLMGLGLTDFKVEKSDIKDLRKVSEKVVYDMSEEAFAVQMRVRVLILIAGLDKK